MIAVQINDQALQRKLAAAQQQVRNPRAVLVSVGREGANLLKAHFRSKQQSQPNKLGGRRQNFWRQVAGAVQAPVVSSSEVVISINHPAIAQKVFGGEIRAKRTRYLTIPVTAEAYGRTARTFEKETGLRLIFIKKPRGGVLASVQGDKTVRVEFVLRESVRQERDETALPDETRFVAALNRRADLAIARQLASTGIA